MNPYINLAKQSVENYLKTSKIIKLPKNLPEEFYNRQAGVFVTIKKDNELRGCIGTFLPARKNIGEEIISNAISAATQDYRFSLITQNELSELNYEVSILSEPERVEKIEDPTKFSEENFRQAELDAKKYGVIVKTTDGRSGLLLPDLDGVDLVEKQISIACQKAGINQKSDKIILYKFTVEKYPKGSAYP
jgi:AmmeMemoRadiSam system protein A